MHLFDTCGMAPSGSRVAASGAVAVGSGRKCAVPLAGEPARQLLLVLVDAGHAELRSLDHV